MKVQRMSWWSTGITPEGMTLLDMRDELAYRDGYTSRPFRTNSDDVLFGVSIINYISALYEVKLTP